MKLLLTDDASTLSEDMKNEATLIIEDGRVVKNRHGAIDDISANTLKMCDESAKNMKKEITAELDRVTKVAEGQKDMIRRLKETNIWKWSDGYREGWNDCRTDCVGVVEALGHHE